MSGANAKEVGSLEDNLALLQPICDWFMNDGALDNVKSILECCQSTTLVCRKGADDIRRDREGVYNSIALTCFPLV